MTALTDAAEAPRMKAEPRSRFGYSETVEPTPPSPPPRKRRRRILSRLLLLFVALVLGVPGGFLFARVIHIPLVESLHTYRPSVITKVYDRNGRVFNEYSIQRRIVVSKEQMSPYLV